MALNACRRNNKMEKRKRNRDYARKFKTVSTCIYTDDKMIIFIVDKYSSFSPLK